MSLILDLLFPKTNLSPLKLLATQPVKYSPNNRLDGVVSLFKYHGSIKEILTDIKFNFVSEPCSRLADIIFDRLQINFPNIVHYWQENNFILAPIPLHPRRQNWRGFNQSELLCQYLSPLLKLNYQNLLIRQKNTLAQSLLPKSSRHKNTSSAFILQQPVSGNFILVDDVYTTGATLNSAASVFSKESILWGLTLAS